MRIPLKSAYRSVPELDRFSPEECRLFLQRVWKDGPYAGTFIVVSFVTFGLTLIVTLALGIWGFVAIATSEHEAFLFDRTPLGWILMAGLIAFVFGIPFLATLVAGDLAYRRFIPKVVVAHAARIRCLRCDYSLLGQIPKDDKLRCPECGRESAFNELGVASEDELRMANAVGTGASGVRHQGTTAASAPRSPIAPRSSL